MNDITRTSNEWNTPWRASGLAVYDANGTLVAHTGITGNRSMPGDQLQRMAAMIAETVNRASGEPRPAASKENVALRQLLDAWNALAGDNRGVVIPHHVLMKAMGDAVCVVRDLLKATPEPELSPLEMTTLQREYQSLAEAHAELHKRLKDAEEGVEAREREIRQLRAAHEPPAAPVALPSAHDVWVRCGNVKSDDVRTVMRAIMELAPRACNHGAISPKGTLFYHGFVGEANHWRCDVCKGVYEGNLTEPTKQGSQLLTLVSSSQPPVPDAIEAAARARFLQNHGLPAHDPWQHAPSATRHEYLEWARRDALTKEAKP